MHKLLDGRKTIQYKGGMKREPINGGNRMTNDPREITARFDSKCAETGTQIKKGDPCIYYPIGKQVFHPSSQQAQTFYGWKFDCDVLGCDY